ncbi:MAG: hypothetical protein V4594_16650 [Bacteroidota bacterium]
MAIDLRQAMEIIRSGEWMSLRCFTADLVKNTGGRIITFTKCRIARLKLMQENNSQTEGINGFAKSANHNYNFTVNLELENNQIRKVHPSLIFELNNQKVL